MREKFLGLPNNIDAPQTYRQERDAHQLFGWELLLVSLADLTCLFLLMIRQETTNIFLSNICRHQEPKEIYCGRCWKRCWKPVVSLKTIDSAPLFRTQIMVELGLSLNVLSFKPA